MFARRIVLCVAGSFALLNLSAAQAAIVPVSRVLHALAIAKYGNSGEFGVTDAPADQNIGAVFGSFTQSADAQGADGSHGTASVHSDIESNKLDFGGSGNFVIGSGINPNVGGGGSVTAIVTLTSPQEFTENAFVSGDSAGLTIKNSSNQFVLQQYTSAFNVDVLLPADTYTLQFSVSTYFTTGVEHAGAGSFTFTTVPEPVIAAPMGLLLIALKRRR